MKARFTYWKESDGRYLGYLNDYPDHWTQGESLDDLKEHLKELFHTFSSEEIPGIRKVEELEPTFRAPGFKTKGFHLWSPFRHTALTFFIKRASRYAVTRIDFPIVYSLLRPGRGKRKCVNALFRVRNVG